MPRRRQQPTTVISLMPLSETATMAIHDPGQLSYTHEEQMQIERELRLERERIERNRQQRQLWEERAGREMPRQQQEALWEQEIQRRGQEALRVDPNHRDGLWNGGTLTEGQVQQWTQRLESQATEIRQQRTERGEEVPPQREAPWAWLGPLNSEPVTDPLRMAELNRFLDNVNGFINAAIPTKKPKLTPKNCSWLAQKELEGK